LFSRGTRLAAFQKRKIELPDETTMTLLSAPDQARLWAMLCIWLDRS
jgi:hypothetical protein